MTELLVARGIKGPSDFYTTQII